MVKNAEKNLVTKIIAPMMRLLSMNESSDHYWYLPGSGEESFKYAWAFYYQMLGSVEKEIADIKNAGPYLKESLMEVLNAVRHLISVESGLDELPLDWFDAEPKLLFYTSRAQLYSEIKGDADRQLMDALGFEWQDALLDRYRIEHMAKEDDFAETILLLNAFMKLVVRSVGVQLDAQKLMGYMAECLSNMQICLSEDEIKAAKEYARNVDLCEIAEECDLRLKKIEKQHGSFIRMIYTDDEVVRLKDEEDFYVYHVVKEKDATYYLGVEAAKLYWGNHRSDSFVQCYRKTVDGGSYEHMPVIVRNGELRVVNMFDK